MTIWKSSSPKVRTSPCPRLLLKAMPMGHHTRTPVPMPGNSRADMNTGSSRAASGTICLKKCPRPLPRLSSMSTLDFSSASYHLTEKSLLANFSIKQPIGHVLTQRRTVMETQNNETTPTRFALRPFRVDMPEEAIADLRRRIAARRWPDKETVADQSQGVQLATIQELARYWATDYDWRKCEAKLNALPQFMTEIDGLDIHFIHVRSKHENALPLIVTHGWPGSVIEQLKIIDPLTNPTAHGAKASDAFDVVIPSVPGHGFSAKPASTGWDPLRIARAWNELMKRVGYTRYVAQGGDWGPSLRKGMGSGALAGLRG